MRAGAKYECEGLGNFSYLPMWVHSWGCWFRVGGGACIRGSVLGSTATKVVVRGSGLGSLLGFFVLSACVVLIVMFACVVLPGCCCSFGLLGLVGVIILGLFLGLFFFRRMVFLLEGVRLWERGLGAVVVALVGGFGG